ncbi:MAG: hypothetical protein LBT99_01625 [Bifidobacteriaceae bacterium]|jgi:hypothetical protein|nr:hypothetical protein [Bifidobacteriaceae bacterium]
MINRKVLLNKFSPILNKIDFESPFSLGNSNYCFNSDITGFQTLYNDYAKHNNPLTIMSNWAWHSNKLSSGSVYTYDDLKLTKYKSYDGSQNLYYAIHPQSDNEEVYDYLRQNPHRLSLGRLRLLIDNKIPKLTQFTNIYQKLNLYDGTLDSKYQVDKINFAVKTFTLPKSDTTAFEVNYQKLTKNSISSKSAPSLVLDFGYPSPSQAAASYTLSTNKLHISKITCQTAKKVIIKRQIDNFIYYIALGLNNIIVKQVSSHKFLLIPKLNKFSFFIKFSLIDKQLSKIKQSVNNLDISQYISDNLVETTKYWHEFWSKTGFINLTKTRDKTGQIDEQAYELQRRIILSQYLLALHSSGQLPPQETGLLCNSWYGKFHLEMHLLHAAYLPLYNLSDKLLPSLNWYKSIVDKAKINASKNGYKGLRWPKMIGPDAIDSPSVIAPLLLWQQTHIIYMLYLIYFIEGDNRLLDNFWELILGTAEFIISFLTYDKVRDTYNIYDPSIPGQEEFEPEQVRNPAFEIAYWKYSLILVDKISKVLHKSVPNLSNIISKMAKPKIDNCLYLSHEACPDTFSKYAKDHPLQLAIFGLIDNKDIDKLSIYKTLQKVLQVWDAKTMWGWDFGYMAMLAARLGKSDLAVDLLLKESPSNYYAKNGHNCQKVKVELPAYLPGNGCLLLAVALLTGGCIDNNAKSDNLFPKNWVVEQENITGLPRL